MQERLVELINQLSNDEITAELLRINDGLNNLFLRYSSNFKFFKLCLRSDLISFSSIIIIKNLFIILVFIIKNCYRYSRYEKNRKSNSRETEINEGSLIDLNVNEPSEMNCINSQVSNLSLNASTASSQLNSITSVIAQNHKDDEFDIFAHSRNVPCEASKPE